MKNRSILRAFFPLSAALLLAVVMTSCSNSTSTTPNSFSYTTPKAGTTYNYKVTQFDSTAGQAGTTTTSDSTSIVLWSGQSYMGKPNVIALLDDSGQTASDTIFYTFESNGDVSVYFPSLGALGYTFTNPTPWLTLPFGSKKTNVPLFMDSTTVNVGGTNLNIIITATASYLYQENISEPTGPILATGNAADITFDISTPFGPIIVTQTFSVDPSIGGYFHSILNENVPVSPFGKASVTIKDRKLTGYTLAK